MSLAVLFSFQPLVLAAPARVVARPPRRPQPEVDGGARADRPGVRGALPPVVPRLRQGHSPAQAGERGAVRRLCSGRLSPRGGGRTPGDEVHSHRMGEGRLR